MIAINKTTPSAVSNNEVYILNVKAITAIGGTSVQSVDTVNVIHSLAANTDANPVYPTINAINPLGVANRSVAYFDALIV